MAMSRSKPNVIKLSLRTLLPVYRKPNMCTVVLTNHTKKHRYFFNNNLNLLYGAGLIRKNYGINHTVSELFVHVYGYNSRTDACFIPFIMDVQYLTGIFPMINAPAFSSYIDAMRHKYSLNNYWSGRYMRRYPCRGQRTRTNASTAKKLHNLAWINMSDSQHGGTADDKHRSGHAKSKGGLRMALSHKAKRGVKNKSGSGKKGGSAKKAGSRKKK